MLEQKLKDAFYWFHQHPELSYQEYQTTQKIKDLLGAAQIEVLPLPLDTGLIAVIRGDHKGPVVALRCDIDGLPITEESGLPYCSCISGQMHACGHDFHITSVLGAAMLLQEKKAELRGTVKIIFQPGEESSIGALKILEVDSLQDVDAIFGIHAEPLYPVGTMAIRSGSVMAAVDRFRIIVKGVGCHGAHPEEGIDPIVVSAAMIQSLQSIVSRNVSADHAVVLSITKMQAGTTWNVIPMEAQLEGTVRTLNKEDRLLLEKRVKEVAEKMAQAYGASAEVTWEQGAPATVNEETMTQLCQKIARQDGYTVVPGRVSMGGEDFAFYLERVKGCFVKVGTGVGHPIHHPAFQIEPEALLGTAKYLCHVAEVALKDV